jgi:Protein of unknown function (DUF2827)
MKQTSKTPPQKYRIAITADVMEEGGFAFYSNGLRQNVFFLCKMFSASPDCLEIILVTNRPAPPIPTGIGIDRVTTRLIDSALGPVEADYFIVAGTAVDPIAMKAQRATGTKMIFYKGGNAAIISIESTISATPDKDGERYADYDCFDEIWMTPQHERTYKGWCETIYRCPVRIIPQIWDPSFLSLQPQSIQDNFGYQPGRAQWKLGILDPNITVMKTSHLPVMVCEYAFRTNPDFIETTFVTNAVQFANNVHFSGFLTLLQIYKAKKMTVEGRFVTWEFLANFVQAIVTHHWENGLNYLYYEVLYGGYPLIHNSEFLKDYGYYYPSFDPEAGGRALAQAFENHDKNLDAYKAKGLALAASLSPTAPHNINLHERLLRGEP